MDNASIILRALDERLDHPVRLILYGRAALQLGFTSPPADVAQSKDVDAIVPLGDVDLSDIRFLIRHDRLTPAQVETAMAEAVLPELPELREAFAKAKPRVMELARQPET